MFPVTGYSAADDAFDRLQVASSDEEVREALSDVMHVLRADPPAAFLVWPREARAADVSLDIPYETGPRCLRRVVAARTGGASGQGAAMKRITSRFVLLIATAAVLPLIVYGFVSMGRLQEGTETSVREGNLEVAEQVASQLKLYIDNNARILRSVGQELSATSLAQWQQTRILTNHVLEFPEFRELSLLDASGRTIATSRIGGSRARLPAPSDRSTQGVHVADVFLDDDALPTTDLSVRLGGDDQGWLVGRLSLEELWRFVDTVRVGQRGLRAGLRRPTAAHRPRRSGEEADRGAGGSGSGQPAVGGRRARRRARVGGDVPRDLRATPATARRWPRSPACRS